MLTEKEKIPFRVVQGEILALDDYLKGADLNIILNKSIEKEYYCSAEGIKLALDFINKNK